MQKLLFTSLGLSFVLLLASCGGGGSSSGITVSGSGGGTQTVLTTSLKGDYFSVPTTDPDFTCSTLSASGKKGMVGAQLGTDGFPVVVSGAPINDFDANGQILWWSTKHAGVVSEVTGKTDSLPFSFSNFFANGQTDDMTYMRTAHWNGSVTVPTTGSLIFNIASDDDLWIFIDRTLVVDDGGIHALQSPSDVTVPITAGNHTIDVFYADRCPHSAILGIAIRQQ